MLEIIFRCFSQIRIWGIFSLILLPDLTHSQECAPTGAKWYYTAPYTGLCLIMESMGDTLIQSKNCKILELRFPNYDVIWSREYLHQSGDSIFYYNYYHESFHLLYNFAANVGDTITVHENTFKPTEGFYDPGFLWEDSAGFFKYKVVAIDSILVSGNWLKRQSVIEVRDSIYLSSIVFPWISDLKGYLLERMGSEVYFFGRANIMIPTYWEVFIGLLRCYQDDELDYTSPEWAGPCDDEIVSIAENPDPGEVKLYPNPVHEGNIIIISESNIEEVTIFNIQGQLVLIKYPDSNESEIDLGHLPIGIYKIQVRLSNGFSANQLLSIL